MSCETILRGTIDQVLMKDISMQYHTIEHIFEDRICIEPKDHLKYIFSPKQREISTMFDLGVRVIETHGLDVSECCDFKGIEFHCVDCYVNDVIQQVKNITVYAHRVMLSTLALNMNPFCENISIECDCIVCSIALEGQRTHVNQGLFGSSNKINTKFLSEWTMKEPKFVGCGSFHEVLLGEYTKCPALIRHAGHETRYNIDYNPKDEHCDENGYILWEESKRDGVKAYRFE